MARLIPSKFEIYRESTKNLNWANYADENVLLATHPYSRKAVDLTDKIMQYAATNMPSLSNASPTFWDSLYGTGRMREVDSDEVEWSLRANGTSEHLIVENVMPGVKYPGFQFQEFDIKLDTERFVVGDTIAPELDKSLECRVEYLPVKDGSKQFIYKLRLVTDDENLFIDPAYFEQGTKWCKISAKYGEASSGYGSTYFEANMSYIRFKTYLTDWGKSVEVTNKAHQLNLKAVAIDQTGNPMKDYPTQIVSTIEANALAEAKAEKNMTIWYGRAASKNLVDQTSGKHVRSGAGVEQFMEDSNLLTYRTGQFEVDIIRDWLQEIGWDKISPENSDIQILTGRMGMTQAHDSIREKWKSLAIHIPWEKFVSSGPSYPGSQSAGYTLEEPAFLSIKLFPYGKITFKHLPLLDNREFNGALVHPDTGLPLSSYYYYIMDYGLGSAGNVELLRRKDSEIYTYICGTWSPVGPINSKTGRSGFVATHKGRYFEMAMADTFGVRIKDVNLTALILPDITN